MKSWQREKLQVVGEEVLVTEEEGTIVVRNNTFIWWECGHCFRRGKHMRLTSGPLEALTLTLINRAEKHHDLAHHKE